MQYQINKKALIIGWIIAVLLIAGGLFLSAQSKRYAVMKDHYILDKWTGIVTQYGQKIYNIRTGEIYQVP
jgi:hypothetical protein